MSASEKIISHIENRRLTPTHLFAVLGNDPRAIDEVHPLTGRSVCFNHTLEEVQARYPEAVVVSIDGFCQAKAATQDSPITWAERTAEKYEEMLCCLPPAAQSGWAFLVGEPWDHHAVTGEPRYEAWKRGKPGEYFVASRPMTKREFRAMFA